MMGFNHYAIAGKRAAKVLPLNTKCLLGTVVVSIRDMQDEGVEGSDFDTVKVRWTRKDLDKDMKAFLAEIGQTTARKGLVPDLVRGGIETKGMQPNQSLHRDDMQDIKCICLPFAIWTGKKKNKDDREVFSRIKHGYLRRLFEPNWMPKSAEPMILEFVLECWDNHGGIRPYASVAFMDFRKLKRRLIAYGKEHGLNLRNWKRIPVGKDAEKYACEGLLFNKNVWYVPLDILVDLARIVIIGDAPRFYKNGRCTVELQEERYRHLCDHATERVPLEEIILDDETESNEIIHPVFTLLRLDAERQLLPR